MAKVKTAEDYEAELAAAKAQLASAEADGAGAHDRGLHDALEWIGQNHHDFSTDQVAAVIDFVNGLKNQNFTNSLEWHTKPEA